MKTWESTGDLHTAGMVNDRTGKWYSVVIWGNMGGLNTTDVTHHADKKSLENKESV